MGADVKRQLRKLLVVIPPNTLQAENVPERSLLKRATLLAERSGATVELFTACHESSLQQGLFAADEDVERSRQERADKAATSLAELSLPFKSANLRVTTEAVWCADATATILRKIEDSNPDLVITESQRHAYILGISTNTDWDLVRSSPSPVWFVNPEVSAISAAITAIGSNTDSDKIISAHDYELFDAAQSVAATLDVPNKVVHAYQVPAGVKSYIGYAPYMGPMSAYSAPNPEIQRQQREMNAVEHGRLLQQFASHFDIDASSIELVQGLPAEVLPTTAEKLGAELIVMGARELSRWQRATEAVAAEPVLAVAECDILFMKSWDESAQGETDSELKRGRPEFNVESAVLDPQGVFDSPAAVMEADYLSARMRRRLLKIWRDDLVAQQTAVGEGGPAAEPVDANRIQEIDELLARLEAQKSDDASVMDLLGRSRVMIA